MERVEFDLGLIEYSKAWDFQKDICAQVKENRLESAVIVCSHPPVITLGRAVKIPQLKLSEPELRQKGIQVYATDRGGDVTYHGPGQLVIYPICNLTYFKRDIHLFLRKLEDVVMQVLLEFGIGCRNRSGLTGVWVGNEKIASLGIAVKNWITYHGVSINIKHKDLENFAFIRPCGMDIYMTSMESVLQREISLQEVKHSCLLAISSLIAGGV
jgi:lipoate-protein ligase B